MKTIRYFIMLLVCMSSYFAHAQEPRLAAGNTFSLRISGVPPEDANQVSQNITISSAGTITLTYLPNPISAAGLTPTELQRKIEQAYKAGDIYTHPTINIMTNNNFTTEMVISVGGEVRVPGDVPFRPGINLFAAINKCGGPTEYGNMKKVKLTRKDGTERVYDMRRVSAANNPEMAAGDQVIVPGS